MTASNGPGGGSAAGPTTNVSSTPLAFAFKRAFESMPSDRSKAVTSYPSSAASRLKSAGAGAGIKHLRARIRQYPAERRPPCGRLERIGDGMRGRVIVRARIAIPEVADLIVNVGQVVLLTQYSAFVSFRRNSMTSGSSSPSTAKTSTIA